MLSTDSDIACVLIVCLWKTSVMICFIGVFTKVLMTDVLHLGSLTLCAAPFVSLLPLCVHELIKKIHNILHNIFL